MPMNPTGPPRETAAPVASDALRNASRCVRCTSTPRLAALSSLIDSRFIDLRKHRKRRERQRDGRQRGDERRVAAHVEVAHQPANRAERLREVGHELHEENQRREERIQRDAGEQQHVGRHPAVLRARQRVDDGHGAERAGKAGDRHRRKPGDPGRQIQRHRQHGAKRRAGRNAQRERRRERIPQQRLKHHAEAASAEPTMAPASTRGSRATKKICASRLSANGIDVSNTRRKSMDVEPTSGRQAHR